MRKREGLRLGKVLRVKMGKEKGLRIKGGNMGQGLRWEKVVRGKHLVGKMARVNSGGKREGRMIKSRERLRVGKGEV